MRLNFTLMIQRRERIIGLGGGVSAGGLVSRVLVFFQKLIFARQDTKNEYKNRPYIV